MINKIKNELGSQMVMMWLPDGHFAVGGNNFADSQAKKAVNSNGVHDVRLSIQDAMRVISLEWIKLKVCRMNGS